MTRNVTEEEKTQLKKKFEKGQSKVDELGYAFVSKSKFKIIDEKPAL